MQNKNIYVNCTVSFFELMLVRDQMLLKWRLSKILERDKEANKELDEWMHQQLDKDKKQEEEKDQQKAEKKDTPRSDEDEKRAALKKELRSMEWTWEDGEDDDPIFCKRYGFTSARGLFSFQF